MNEKEAIEHIQLKVNRSLNSLKELAYNIHHYNLSDESFQEMARRNYDEELERFLALKTVLDLAKKQLEEKKE